MQLTSKVFIPTINQVSLNASLFVIKCVPQLSIDWTKMKVSSFTPIEE